MYYGSTNNFRNNESHHEERSFNRSLTAPDIPDRNNRSRSHREKRRDFRNVPRANSRYGRISGSNRRTLSQNMNRWRGLAKRTSVLSVIVSDDDDCSTVNDVDHSYLYTMLNPRSHRRQAVIFKRLLTAIVLFDIVMFTLSTETEFQDYDRIFYIWEGTISTIFLIEYVARLIVVMEWKRYQVLGPFWGRLRYSVSIQAVIDALATFPFFLELMTRRDLPTLTYLRVLRLLRLLKTESYMKVMNSVTRVLYFNRTVLYVGTLICFFLVFLTGVLLYYLSPQDTDDWEYNSIASSMYLTTLILTGQGGPDDPLSLPYYTQAVLILSSLFSVAMFAIPASMLTWGFEAEAERMAKESFRKAHRSADDSFSSSNCEEWRSSDESSDTSDDEYQKIIAGDVATGTEEPLDFHSAVNKLMHTLNNSNNGDTKKQLQQTLKATKAHASILNNSYQLNDLGSRNSFLNSSTPPSDTPLETLTNRITILEQANAETNIKLDRLLFLVENKLQ